MNAVCSILSIVPVFLCVFGYIFCCLFLLRCLYTNWAPKLHFNNFEFSSFLFLFKFNPALSPIVHVIILFIYIFLMVFQLLVVLETASISH